MSASAPLLPRADLTAREQQKDAALRVFLSLCLHSVNNSTLLAAAELLRDAVDVINPDPAEDRAHRHKAVLLANLDCACARWSK